jgi:ABC-2 type transport system permease protein
MITDIWTVMMKEWREYLAGTGTGGGGGRGRGVVALLLIIGVISILLPLQEGRDLLTSPIPVIVDGLYLPIIILLNLVADSFAGERERHTLETLLASRLSDRAILLGKVAASVGFGWSLSMVAALIQAVVANLSPKNAGTGGGLAFYPVGSVVAIVVLGLMTALLASSAGCLVSLRASSTRQAQVNLGVGFMVLIFVPFIVLQLLPSQTRSGILDALNAATPGQVFLVFVVVLLVVDIVLVGITLALFQRARLILS